MAQEDDNQPTSSAGNLQPPTSHDPCVLKRKPQGRLNLFLVGSEGEMVPRQDCTSFLVNDHAPLPMASSAPSRRRSRCLELLEAVADSNLSR
jgi:hypothetical protein